MTLAETGRFGDEILSTNELVERTHRVLTLYAHRSVEVLGEMVRKGQGRQVLGSVPQRPEDEQLGIDAIGENILGRVVEEENLPCFIVGEHNKYRYVNASEETPHVILPTDPFDNSSQYKRGLDTPPYSVTGAYHSDGEPIGAVISDIKDQKVYVAGKEKTYVIDLKTGETTSIARSRRTTILENNATLATYLGSNEYSLSFFDHFRKLIEDMPPKTVLYAGGGAYIYGLLASGAVDAYVMLREPRTEIDPGLPLALAAGCTAVSVNPDGTFEEYRFDYRRHDESVPLFIAACTPEVRDEIIRYYVEGQKAA
ncbi:MAG: inositol monophosphatase family protein [bacterium]|nr:inositol monophosphatase family protein [bacterium]